MEGIVANMEEPRTPKSDYSWVDDDEPLPTSFGTPFNNLDLPSNLPMLDSSHYALERDSTSAVDDRATALSDVAIGTRRRRTPFPALPSTFQRALRWWLGLRWKLSRSFFSVPIPLLTAEFDVKLGDLVVIVPVVSYLVAVTALQAKDRNVKGSGSAPSITMMLVFLMAIRNNSVLLVATGIPFERVLLYHKLFAFITIILTALHGLAYVLDRADSGVDFHHDQMVTGMVAFVGMVAMYILSLNYIRRRFFELFLRLHWILFLVVVFFTVKHGAPLVLVGLIPWAIDMVFRVFYRPYVHAKGSIFKKRTQTTTAPQEKRSRGVISRDQLKIVAMPGKITRISFPRVRYDTGEAFEYEAGQYAYVCIPRLSLLQWHPFTISSAPHEAMVTFHVKALGDWTAKLHDLASAGELDTSPIDVLVDGPYGSVAIDIDSVTTYSHFVLFSGGIGVTPMRSIANWLHYECHYHSREGAPKVRFVWSVRDRDMIESVLNQAVEEADRGQEVDEVAPYLPQILQHPRTTNDSSGDFYSEIYQTIGHPDLEARGDHHFKNCMRYGVRPDVAQILREMGHEALKSRKQRVAVLVCGPPTMVHDVVKASTRLSREMRVRFDVHSEVFQF
jgi:predicted ferric reductase